MTDRYKVMCGCECCMFAKSMHLSLLTWRDHHLKQPKDIIQNVQNIRSGELSSSLFETYKNSVRPHGCHICNYSADITMSTMCPFPSQNHGLPQYKHVIICCDKYPGIIITYKKTNTYATNNSSEINFHVYHNVSRCNVHVICPYE